MSLSYWEIKSWLSNVDFTIVGSGIVGLNCAIHLKESFPNAKVLVLERGMLPQGASTKNAGFACFGSVSELLADLKNHTPEEVLELVKKRYEGLQLLRYLLGDKAIDYQEKGGYELFIEADECYDTCLTSIPSLNTLLEAYFNDDVYSVVSNNFSFQGIQNQLIFNQFEGQIDTGKMMVELLRKAQSKGILILNNCTVDRYHSNTSNAEVSTSLGDFYTGKLFIATNGFAKSLIASDEVKPARAQVLVTKPIENLHIEGTFHIDQGYYYFRNIDNRILFGGGRNLDFKTEETTAFGQTALIQQKLDTVLREIILPKTPFEVAHRWSGIMGIGKQKKAIVKQLDDSVYCGVRLGGMGVAIGSLVGKELADLATT